MADGLRGTPFVGDFFVLRHVEGLLRTETNQTRMEQYCELLIQIYLWGKRGREENMFFLNGKLLTTGKVMWFKNILYKFWVYFNNINHVQSKEIEYNYFKLKCTELHFLVKCFGEFCLS